ncbi:MAG: hypothetical protein HC882_03910, partial [Acidobacteria bacterium]|nr:hypothetical protein [Acidobacteriota bacterium]
AVEVPHAQNNRKTTPFWTQLANNGWDVGVVRVPVTFPSEELPEHSVMVSGLGVPDMRGRVGTPSLWTTDPAYTSTDNQFSLEITKLPARRGLVETKIIGPTNYPFHVYVLDRAEEQWREEGVARAEIRERRKQLATELEAKGYPQQINLKLMLDIKDDRIEYTLQDGTKGSLKPGEWSDFVRARLPSQCRDRQSQAPAWHGALQADQARARSAVLHVAHQLPSDEPADSLHLATRSGREALP